MNSKISHIFPALLPTTIHEIVFTNRILTGSGCWAIKQNQIEKIIPLNVSGVVSKTCTFETKEGNPKPNYIDMDSIRFNCKGLCNYGYEYYKQIFVLFENSKKNYVLSVYSNDVQLEYILNDYDQFVDKKVIVEINVSCPNINDRINGYHLVDIGNMLEKIKKLNLKNIQICLKLPPYFEKEKIIDISQLLNKYTDIVKFVTVCNSIPCFYGNLSKEFCGISGNINKYISIGNIKMFRKILSDDIAIIGSGGIQNIDDVNEYLNSGAQLVNIASGFYDKDNDCINVEKVKREFGWSCFF